MTRELRGDRVVFQAATLAAIVAIVCIVLMALVQVSAGRLDVELQPSIPSGPLSEFVRATNEHPELALRFFAVDSLFVSSYLMVFVGLYAVTGERSRAFAAVGLGAGVLAALLDAIENAYLINYALLATHGVELTDPALPLIFNVANLKWMAAFTAMYAFGLVWPRENVLGWLISVLMLLFPVVGVLGIAMPALVQVRLVLFIVGMPLFAWYFWRRAKGTSGG
jgi:hypothetical protein